MLASLLGKVRSKASAVEAYLALCQSRDEALSDQAQTRSLRPIQDKPDAATLQDDRVFRHCSVITHLYAVYENFVEASLTTWLGRIPKYHPFSDLGSNLQNAYRIGIATVIKEIANRQFRHLSLGDVLEKYASCLKNYEAWQIVPEALTLHKSNLRRQALQSLFSTVGITHVWSVLEKHPSLQASVSALADGGTLESVLEDFVTFRNEASHGMPDDLLGLDSLRQWISFTVSLCEAINDALTIALLDSERGLHPECVVGIVTEKFSGRIVVAKCRNCGLSVGQKLYFLKPHSVITATIESLQINDVDVPRLEIGTEEIEVGIETSQPVKNRSQILRIQGEFRGHHT